MCSLTLVRWDRIGAAFWGYAGYLAAEKKSLAEWPHDLLNQECSLNTTSDLAVTS